MFPKFCKDDSDLSHWLWLE